MSEQTVVEKYLKYAQEKIEKEANLLQNALNSWIEEIKSQPRDFSKEIILTYNHNVATFYTGNVRDIICTFFDKAFNRKVIWFQHSLETIYDDATYSSEIKYKCSIKFDNNLQHQLETVLTHKKKLEEQEQEIMKKIKLGEKY